MEKMEMEKISAVTAVIRSFNNPGIYRQVKNLLGIGVGKVIVVINSQPDKGATAGFLGNLIDDSRVRIIEIDQGYTWSNALNRALMSIYMDNLIGGRCQYVLNISVEAKFNRHHLAKMLAEMQNLNVGVVGTSFAGIMQDSQPVSLGESYKHPRNTGMLIRLNMGTTFYGFDPYCDEIGGMEDIDFILRMTATSSMKPKMLDLRIPLLVGNNYYQPKKEENERRAMKEIVARWRSFFPEGAPERKKIEACISDLSLFLTIPFVPRLFLLLAATKLRG